MDIYSTTINAIIKAIEADPGGVIMPWH